MIETSGESARTRRTRSATSSVSSACMAAMPTTAGRDARSCAATELVKRRSASVTRWPRASSAAAMYSMPSGSIRKNGPRPNRSFAGTGRSSRTFIVRSVNVTYDPHFVGSLVSAVVRWAHRHRGIVVAAVLGAVLVSAEGARRLTFDADVLSLLPHDSPVIQSFRDFLARFGSLDQLYVVFTAPDGHSMSEYGDQVAAWVDGLRGAPEISRVDAGVVDRTRDFGWLADHQLLLLPDRLLDEALRRLTPDGLRAASAARRELLTVPSPEVADLVRQDPAALFDLLRDALGGAQAGFSVGIGADGYVTPDGHGRLVIARPKRPPYDAEFSRALDARLRGIEQAIAGVAAGHVAAPDEEPRPPLRVQFAGGHRIAVETEAVVRRESILNTVGSLVVILPLLFIVFRSVWLVTVGSLPSLLSLVLVLGAIGFTGARLSAAATGAAAMMFGLGVDGVVLLYVAHRLALAERADI